jgi:chaperonin GroES
MNRTQAMLISAKITAAGGALYGDKVAVIRDDPTEISEGGIIIPDQAQRKPLRGRCVLIGLGVVADQLEKGNASPWTGLAIGDFLSFSKYDGTIIEIPLPDETITIEVLHAFDVYVGFGREE